jgi:hypothetical protein
MILADVADPAAVEAAAASVEEQLGPIDVWVNVAFTSVFCSLPRDPAGGVPPVDRSELSGLRERHARRPASHGSERPWRGDPGRVGPRHAFDTPAIGILRRQARHRRLHRVGAVRAAPPEEPGPTQHRPVARRQHTPVRLGAVPVASTPSAGPPDLPARGHCRCGRSDSSSSPRGSVGRRLDGGDTARPEDRRCSSTATWGGPAISRSRPRSGQSPTLPSTFGPR